MRTTKAQRTRRRRGAVGMERLYTVNARQEHNVLRVGGGGVGAGGGGLYTIHVYLDKHKDIQAASVLGPVYSYAYGWQVTWHHGHDTSTGNVLQSQNYTPLEQKSNRGNPFLHNSSLIVDHGKRLCSHGECLGVERVDWRVLLNKRGSKEIRLCGSGGCGHCCRC